RLASPTRQPQQESTATTSHRQPETAHGTGATPGSAALEKWKQLPLMPNNRSTSPLLKHFKLTVQACLRMPSGMFLSAKPSNWMMESLPLYLMNSKRYTGHSSMV